MPLSKVAAYETVDAATVAAISKSLGLGAIVVRMGDVDTKYGAGVLGPMSKCLWTKDRFRITITSMEGSGSIADISKQPDPDCPDWDAQPPKDEPNEPDDLHTIPAEVSRLMVN